MECQYSTICSYCVVNKRVFLSNSILSLQHDIIKFFGVDNILHWHNKVNKCTLWWFWLLHSSIDNSLKQWLPARISSICYARLLHAKYRSSFNFMFCIASNFYRAFDFCVTLAQIIQNHFTTFFLKFYSFHLFI